MFAFISLFLFTLYNVHALLVEPRKLCVKYLTVSGACHFCECSDDGIFNCTANGKCKEEKIVAHEVECEPELIYQYEELYCTCNMHGQWRSDYCRRTFRLMEFANTSKHIGRSNVGVDSGRMPEIRKGEACVPGKTYKLSCNTCRCGENNVLLCTKMACFHSEELKKLQKKHKKTFVGAQDNKKPLITGSDSKPTSPIESKNYVEENGDGPVRRKLMHPNTALKKCVPGKVYKKECHKCYCTDERKLSCIKTNCDPIKISYEMNAEEMSKIDKRRPLPRLSHVGEECDPGKVYQVDCNKCWCSDKRELSTCSQLVCLDTSIYWNIQASRLSGQKCKSGYSSRCIKCNCVDNKTECTPVNNCTLVEGKNLAPGDVKTSLDSKVDHCVPNMSYRIHCNDCKCLPDGNLICTTNLCLKYSEVKSLEERFKYLQENGL